MDYEFQKKNADFSYFRKNEAAIAAEAASLLESGDDFAVARAEALCRNSEPVAAVAASCKNKTEHPLHAALLSYGLGKRAKDLVYWTRIYEAAAGEDSDALTALAYYYEDASLFPRAFSPAFRDEMATIAKIREELLQRSVDPSTARSADDVELVLDPQRVVHAADKDAVSSFVVHSEPIRDAVSNFRAALRSNVPVLVQGPAGSGKSAITSHVVKLAASEHISSAGTEGWNGMARFHLDGTMGAEEEFTDMMGSVVPKKDGSFGWQPGALGAAIEQGKWVVLEGIGGVSASGGSSAVASTIEALATAKAGEKIRAQGSSEFIVVGVGFKLIATLTVQTGHLQGWEPPGGWRLWYRISLPELEPVQVESILSGTTSDFCARRIAGAFEVLAPILRGSTAKLKEPTLRDGVKLSKRLEPLQSLTNQRATFESIDVLCASLPSGEVRKAAVAAICDVWSVLASVGEHYEESEKPTVEATESGIKIGRALLLAAHVSVEPRRPLAHTGSTLRLMESVARCVELDEHVLLSGETGTGKTALVQELARLCSKDLVVLNMSQQSDVSDLMGGFRPFNGQQALALVLSRFEEAFRATLSVKRNKTYLSNLRSAARKRDLPRAVRLIRQVLDSLPAGRRGKSESVAGLWQEVERSVSELEDFLQGESEPEPTSTTKRRKVVRFKYAEGSLLKAMRSGSWVLLDELNLAPTETLERLIGLLDESRMPPPEGGTEFVNAEHGFLIFAAMNPPTDQARRSLPDVVRSRFTEFYVGDSMPASDLALLIYARMYPDGAPDHKNSYRLCEDAASFFLKCRQLSDEGQLEDAAGKLPRYSLRSLSRMVDFCAAVGTLLPTNLQRRALYEGALLAFATPLPRAHRGPIRRLATTELLHRDKPPLNSLAEITRAPGSIKIGGFLIKPGDESIVSDESFIVTPSVEQTLEDVARAVAVGAPKLPVLLQGPTAAGKTSLVTYLARMSGHRVIRINNHEHTDVAEYLGGYAVDEGGSLSFQEGPLVKAARFGWWILLDELNLAPAEVLEAMNRLLDDNREVRVPDTGEVVKAHPQFALFATQNPPGVYAGRKQLSLAFRSRFIEIQVDDMPEDELQIILSKRGNIPESFAVRMIKVMAELQKERSMTRLFRGKEGFVTARDLFRWAARSPASRNELAAAGYMLLAERARLSEQRSTIRQILQNQIGGDSIQEEELYRKVWNLPQIQQAVNELNIAANSSMVRMVALLWESAASCEPALMVGETGGGKTTACQIVARALGLKLYTVNLHRNSEASDFIGGFRPTSQADPHNDQLFEWADGPLIQAMREGSCILVDELNMADHAVTERLNSVLEPARTILLSEKGGGSSVESVVARKDFRLFATMNPGGDYGKKELSAALQNRFTEIWVPTVGTKAELRPVVQKFLTQNEYSDAVDAVCNVAEWCYERQLSFTMRDAAAWAHFIGEAVPRTGLHPLVAFAHGARLLLIDGLEVSLKNHLDPTREVDSLASRLWAAVLECIADPHLREEAVLADLERPLPTSKTATGISFGPFEISFGSLEDRNETYPYVFDAVGTAKNCLRVARACTLERAILLEGPPGVGKTTVVEALASASNRRLIRVNLSEQTEMSDLVGCNVPTSTPGRFVFKDGPLLQAIRAGEWILLDELNLASQSVLEGLNAVLDHRRSVFVPELGMEFSAGPEFRLFGAQNPAVDGFGRRRLPRSFLNRFTRIYVQNLTQQDKIFVAAQMCPWMEVATLEKVANLLDLLQELVDLNLRDVLRWCELARKIPESADIFDILVLQRLSSEEQRIRAQEAFQQAFQTSNTAENEPALFVSNSTVRVGPLTVARGTYISARDFSVGSRSNSFVAKEELCPLRALAAAAGNGWPACIKGLAGSGKRNLVSTFAGLCGKRLVKVRLSSSSDTSDLLGGYEQGNASKNLGRIHARLDVVTSELLKNLVHEHRGDTCAAVDQERLKSDQAASDHAQGRLRDSEFSVRLKEHCLSILRLGQCMLKDSEKRVIEGAMREISKVSEPLKDDGLVFQWTRGELLEAAEQGHWVVIDNVNEVPWAVMDRLNPLLEKPGATTLLAEAPPDSEGRPQTFRAAPGFQLFLTMDPSRGDISKALKNRCVEVTLQEYNLKNQQSLAPNVLGSGIPGPVAAAADLLLNLEQRKGANQPTNRSITDEVALTARVMVAGGENWANAYRSALSKAVGTASELVDHAIASRLDYTGFLECSVEKIVALGEQYEARRQFKALTNLFDLKVEVPLTAVADKYVHLFMQFMDTRESIVEHWAGSGLKSQLREAFVRETCALYAGNATEYDRQTRVELLANLDAGSGVGRKYADIALRVLNGEDLHADASASVWILLSEASSIPSDHPSVSTEWIRYLRDVKGVLRKEGQGMSSGAARRAAITVIRMGEVLEQAGTEEEASATVGHLRRSLARCLPLFGSVDLATNDHNADSFEDTEGLPPLYIPVPVKMETYELEARLLRAVNLFEHEGFWHLGAEPRKSVVEALCTLSSSVEILQPVKEEFKGMIEQLEAAPQDRSKIEQGSSAWSRFLNGVSLQQASEAISSSSSAAAKRALHLGLHSKLCSPLLLLSLQRHLWEEPCNFEAELQLLQRLWSWDLAGSCAADWWTRGPLAAMVFDGPLRLLLQFSVRREQSDGTAARDRSSARDDLAKVFLATARGWGAKWIGVRRNDNMRKAIHERVALEEMTKHLLELAQEWMETGHQLVESSMPAHCLDPVQEAKAIQDLASSEFAAFYARDRALDIMAAASMGHNRRETQSRKSADGDGMWRASRSYGVASQRVVYRSPSADSYEQVWHRMRRLCDGLASRHRVEALKQRIDSRAEASFLEEESWQNSLGGVLTAFAAGNSSYPLRDCLGKAALGLERLRSGVQLYAGARALQTADEIDVQAFEVLIKIPSSVDDLRVLKEWKAGSAEVQAAILSRLTLCGAMTLDLQKLANSAVENLVKIWRGSEDERNKYFADLQQLYSYGSNCRQDETLEEAEERDFRNTFGDDQATEGASESSHTTQRGARSDSTEQATVEDLWHVFRTLCEMSQSGRPEDETRMILFAYEKSFAAALSILKSNPRLPLAPDFLHNSASAAYLSAALCLRDHGKEPSKLRATKFNFYRDSLPDELATVMNILGTLMEKTARIRNTEFFGEDHAVLSAITTSAGQIANSDSQTPMSLLTAAAERLLQKVAEWNRNYAFKALKLEDEERLLAMTTAKWRSMELASWPSLLEERVKLPQTSVCRWMPRMYEVVAKALCESEPEESEFNELLSVLDQFLRSASVGELSARRELLACFAVYSGWSVHRDAPGNASLLSTMMSSLAGYYEQYQQEIEAFVRDGKSPLEAKMKEYTKLGEWDPKKVGAAVHQGKPIAEKDLEYFRLKAAADRNRRNLHKLCVQMDSVLRTPLSSIQQSVAARMGMSELEGEPEKVSYSFPGTQEHAAASSSANESYVQREWKGRLGRLQELRERIALESEECRPKCWITLGLDCSVHIETNARERALELANLKPSKDLIPVKQRAFTELLRYLAHSGISSHRSQQRVRSSFDWLRSPGTGIIPVDRQFYRCVVRNRKLVEVSGSTLNADVSRREGNLMMSYADHLLTLLAEDRSALGETKRFLKDLESMAADMQRFSPGSWTQPSAREAYTESVRSLRTLASEAESFAAVISAACSLYPNVQTKLAGFELSSAECTGVAERLRDLSKRLLAGLTRLDDPEGADSRSRTAFTSQALRRRRATATEALIAEISSSRSTEESPVESTFCSAALMTAASLRRQLASDLSEGIRRPLAGSERDGAEASVSSGQEELLEEKASQCLNLILVSVQSVRSKLSAQSESEDADEDNAFDAERNSIALGHKGASALTRILQLQRLCDDFDELLGLCAKAATASDAIVQLVRELGTTLQCFLSSTLRPLLQGCFELHSEGCRLLRCMQCIFITVAERGFCRPQEESEPVDGEDKVVSGTGMADVGEGDASNARDVSGEMEDETQLEGLQHQDEKEDPNAEQQTSEGMEVGTDFKAELNDVEKDEEDDPGENSDQEEKEDPEAAFGDAEGTEEAVDEKLWDGDGSEDEDDTGEKGAPVKKGEGESEIGRKDEKAKEDPGPGESDDGKPIEEEKLDQNEQGDEQGDEEAVMQDEIPAEQNFSMNENHEAPAEESAEELPEKMDIDNNEGDQDMSTDGGASQAADDDEMNPPDGTMNDPDEAGEMQADEDAGAPDDNHEVDQVTLPSVEPTAMDPTDDTGNERTDGGDETKDAETEARPQEASNTEKLEQDGGGGGGPSTDDPNEKSTGSGAHWDHADAPSDGPGGDPDQERNPKKVPAPELSARWKKRREILNRNLNTLPEDGEDTTKEQETEAPVAYDETGEDVDRGAAEEDQHQRMDEGDLKPPEAHAEADKDQPMDAEDLENSKAGPKRARGQEFMPEIDEEQEDQEAEYPAEDQEGRAAQEDKEKRDAGKGTVEGASPNGADGPEDDVEVRIVQEIGKDIETLSIEARLETADKEWKRLSLATSHAASFLCEQLRLLLEPTVATRLAGDYRTGKRLSMKRVIEFVASDYRRDRIWLRRTKPEKRAYDVLICIDDSESMLESGAGGMAMEALALISSALMRLEVGRIGVASFGSATQILHGFDSGAEPNGGHLLASFTFEQKTTNVKNMIESALAVLDDARLKNAKAEMELEQLVLVISDGKLDDREAIQRLVREAVTKRQIIAFFLIDNSAEGANSIRNIRRVVYSAGGKMSLEPYLDSFPFPFYAIVGDASSLPNVVADALRQWFEVVNSRSMS